MAWSDQLSAYCERLAPGWWGEPLNALSNIAFVLAALALLRLRRQMRERGETIPTDVRALPWSVWGVALCSLLFHTLATRWTGWLDSLSILLFCGLGVFSFLRHAVHASILIGATTAAGFALASFVTSHLAHGALNGSAAYLPNLIALLAVTTYLGLHKAPAFRAFTLACVIFAVALMLRTMDLAWCARLPIGTHFVWHLLTGLLLWVVGRELTLRRFHES